MRKLHVVHIINSFEYGGAEAMLCNLVLRTDPTRFRTSVVSLIDDLTVAGPLLKVGIPVEVMHMKPGVPSVRAMVRLAHHLHRLRPDVIQTWMDHSNLIGGLAAKVCPGAAVVWGVHHSNHVKGVAKRSTLMTVAACAKLSRVLPKQIICCSEHARNVYESLGFDARRMCVIPNGFDTQTFRPSVESRRQFRQALGIADDTPVIGLAARFDPFKDHATFVRAAGILSATHPNVRFVMCGLNVDERNAVLSEQIDSLKLRHAIHMLGARRDMPNFHGSLDISTSSSISEAFPLAVGEAMACGVPCVVTDVGDSKLIVGNTGRVVAPRDPQAMADAWRELLQMPSQARREIAMAARERIVRNFDLDHVTRRYENVYCTVSRKRSTGMALCRPPRALRVLMIVESSAGGTGRHVLDLSRGLCARGCEVHIIHSTRRIDRLFLDARLRSRA